MQKYLALFPTYIRSDLIDMISDSLGNLITDSYGNYFCQKLYIISTDEQRVKILEAIKDIFVSISKVKIGGFVIQKIIEESDIEEEKKIILGCVKGHELELSLDNEGTHVLQKIIQSFSEKERQELTDFLVTGENFKKLISSVNGINVIKRLQEFMKEKQNQEKMTQAIFENCMEFVVNPSTKSILQTIMEQWEVEVNYKIMKFCAENCDVIALQKYNSNIIDKIIDVCEKHLRNYEGGDFRDFGNIKELVTIIKNKLFFDKVNVISAYKNKFGKCILIKLRDLLDETEEEKIDLFIKNLEDKSECGNVLYSIYTELMNPENNFSLNLNFNINVNG